MSVLMNLPNELCYDIMSRWINYDHEFYITILLIDAVVMHNADLRLLLLNHFNFCKSLEKKHFISRIHFNWEDGYTCDVLDAICEEDYEIYGEEYCQLENIEKGFTWRARLQVEGIYPIVRCISSSHGILAEEMKYAVQFVNNCRKVKEINVFTDQILVGLSQHILTGLTTIEVGGGHANIQYHAGFKQIKLHCRQLTKFRVFGFRANKNDTKVSPVMNEIVANNPSLQSIHIPTNYDIFNILINNNGNYANLHTVILYIREEVVSVSNIIEIINKYPYITYCDIHTAIYNFSWYVEANSNAELKVEWIFCDFSDEWLRDAAEYTAETTTSIKIISVKSLNNFTLKNFQKLNSLDIQCCIKDITWIETVHCFPLTLNDLVLHGITVSVVVTVLNRCRELRYYCCYEAIDDSHNDSTIVTQLRTTLSEYSDCLEVFHISFKHPRGVIDYDNGDLIVCDIMKHYVTAEKCLQRGQDCWTEKLM